MGLDQYLYKSRKAPIAVEEYTNDDSENLAYWRKHPNLQGFMENLWKEKTGKDEEFNCENVYLTEPDLDIWEQIVKNNKLPETDGPFFGFDSDEEYKEYDLKVINRAREALKQGYTVYYTSWW